MRLDEFSWYGIITCHAKYYQNFIHLVLDGARESLWLCTNLHKLDWTYFTFKLSNLFHLILSLIWPGTTWLIRITTTTVHFLVFRVVFRSKMFLKLALSPKVFGTWITKKYFLISTWYWIIILVQNFNFFNLIQIPKKFKINQNLEPQYKHKPKNGTHSLLSSWWNMWLRSFFFDWNSWPHVVHGSLILFPWDGFFVWDVSNFSFPLKVTKTLMVLPTLEHALCACYCLNQIILVSVGVTIDNSCFVDR